MSTSTRRRGGRGGYIEIENRASKNTVLDEPEYDQHSYEDEIDEQNHRGQFLMSDGRHHMGNHSRQYTED